MRWHNPTGGIGWHARACRSKLAWRDTSQTIESWLLEKSPLAQRLVVVGASAGWMLSHSWLTRFKEVHTWDIDPWAKPLFHWLHGKSLSRYGISWIHHENDPWLCEHAWQDAGPDTIYWFDNVLGQLPLIMLSQESERRIRFLQQALKATHWGSIHDRYSGPIQGHRSLAPAWASLSGIGPADIHAQKWLQNWGAEGDWSDHLTSGVFRPGTPVLNVAWAFKPKLGHWLEMGWQTPDS
jgi:hypothetical protein